jgi:RNA 3'-terminal phosphate cyclase (ATP)
MAPLIAIDGSQGEGGGQVLRTALALSALTGQGFEITKIRERRSRPGLRPQHLAAVRAASLICQAKVGGVYDGSPDLRFEPGQVHPGDFRFDIATAGAATLVMQTIVAPLATASGTSRVEVTGGTHVPHSPSYHYFAQHWSAMVARLGLVPRFDLVRAGFYPPGGGEIRAEVPAWSRPAAALDLETPGALVEIVGTAGARDPGKGPGGLAIRLADAARERLWEARRLESRWSLVDLHATSPGSFLLLEAVFERSRAAFGFLGERGVRPEVLGDRAARTLLGFLDTGAAVDPYLADQLAVPLAIGGGGGRVATNVVTAHLETVAAVVSLFGIGARTWGRRGGPGGLEVDPC